MSLSRVQVVAAALEILDEYGLGDLTMRRLATSLGVQPGALYWHVANKQALLAEVADAIVADLPGLTAGEAPERAPAAPDRLDAPEVRSPAEAPAALEALAEVAGWARALRRTLLAHRDGADVVATAYALRSDQDPTVSALTDRVRAAGVPRAQADAGSAALVHYVLGHTAHEQAHAQLVAGAPAGAEAGHDAGERFELGLALLLDGLALRAVEPPA
ncbi:TetR family transcriptional regulator [Cellulomonas cellasea]|uniref:AcrR family transcriptional regulator n=1 Tax=Cellulomonas cellasea TaxID=43670 RepID=A0A7W4UD10_9CELL|nr:TetR family transcriptional regulator [Cellulomonas cellasea]MBB2921943.1 AcrR family transcriptional regulator [Cellulomonas cellasea]